MATQSQFIAAPTLDYVVIGTADTSATAATAIATVASGPATTAGSGVGKRITRVSVNIPGTSSVGLIRWYVSADNGTTNRLILETPVTAVTGTSTSIMFSTTVFGLVGLVLPGGTGASTNMLRATSTVNTGVQIVCESGTL